MRHLFWLVTLCFIGVCLSCASHRKQANCSEIRYRLDHLQYSPEQREWIEGEWTECKYEQDSLAKIDAVKFRGIYEQFVDSSSVDSTTKDSTIVDTIQ